MTNAAALLDRLLPADAAPAADLDARAWLDTHGFPTTREEAWRYTPVDKIVADMANAHVAPPERVELSTVDELAGDHGGPRLVFVNGVYVDALSHRDTPVPGVWWGERSAAPPVRVTTRPAPEELTRFDGFQALNRAAGGDAAMVVVDAGVEMDEPIHLVHIAVGSDGLAAIYPRTVVEVAAGGRATIIETFTGLGGHTLTNASTSITLGRGATVSHNRVQTEALGALHVGHTRVHQDSESTLRSVSVMLGADIARHEIDVGLYGADATVDLTGLYLPAGRQRHDNVVTVDHAADRGTSTQTFTGVIDDEARGSFGGRIIVQSGTVANDADQANRNLLLARTAQADTRPWLEILADDVRCTHGATVGRLDDEALFYLRSRGIPLAEARAMLVGAFIREIVDPITPPSLSEQITNAVAAHRAPTVAEPGEAP